MAETKTIDDGGTAFPATVENGCNSGVFGMSLRDYMAAKAMQSLVAYAVERYEISEASPVDWIRKTAANAYQFADAMIAAKNEPSD